MNFLLKIVEGPNKGAEIALVEGLCVSIGKADSCDIILADPTLPDAPLQIEAAADGVSLEMPGEGRSHLEMYHAVTVGSTSFAVGSADAAWPAIVWPKREEPKEEEAPAEASASEEAAAPEEKKAESEKKPEEEKKRGGWLIPVAIIVVLLILGLICWLFWGRIATWLHNGEQDAAETECEVKVSPIDALVERYSLEKSEVDGNIVLKGDFRTRVERLGATAEAYAAQPGIRLDFADEESLKTAVEDTFSLVGENELRVTGVTNRVAVMAGKAKDLHRALEAVAADVPNLANVDCSAVTASPDSAAAVAARKVKGARRKTNAIDFPVCGILTSPYPCLVMSNGMRILEGAPFADGAIVKIEADRVVFTNSTGRVIWKP